MSPARFRHMPRDGSAHCDPAPPETGSPSGTAAQQEGYTTRRVPHPATTTDADRRAALPDRQQR